ncbi:hypothetical protein [Wolbachia endosymbiont (group B) of Camptogramma bilineatum]|uniref:hypothetical protein n=1 Tax=Wolbachia endosymbiont (group B) of Camptogramma bilineatum TaxID=2953991 RepID=UPI00222EBAFB|nr:hypothetical protein [Wolbachia endosymbiont (group B) of Camptogramma bilineatum]
MWESIKKFFKWIADRTGISWIARKISSGWNWLFSSKANTAQENISPKRPSDENVNKSPTVSTPMQNETEEPVSKTGTNVEPAENFPEKSNDEPKGVGYIELDEDNHLWLVLEKGIKVQDYQGSQNEVEPLFNLLIYLRCDKEEYCITGVGNFIHNCYGISVKSIIKKNRDGNYIDNDKILVQDNIEHMKKMLGLKDDVTEIKVDSISNQPFEGTALEQHNLNPTTSQQTVNNKEVTTESEKLYDTINTQPSLTIGVPSTERHYVTNPSVNGNGYY